MNLITTPKTMTTLEVAELVESRHDNVMTSAKRLADRLGWALPAMQEKTKGRPTTYLELDKNQSLTLVAQLMPEFLQRVVERWQELEAQQAPQVPQTYAAALLEAGRLALENEQLQLEAKQNAPKVEFYEQVTGSSDTVDMAQAAKVLNMGIGRNKLFELLRNEKVLQSNNQPYQTYIDRGYFRMVESKYQKNNGDTHINIKTVVYQKGLDFIRKLISKGV